MKVGDLVKCNVTGSVGIVLELNPIWINSLGIECRWDYKIMENGSMLFVDSDEIKAVI